MGHRSCCVVDCKNTSRKSKCKFYKFPTAKWKINQRQKWIVAVRRRNVDGSPWVPKPNDCICSEHFIGGKKSVAESSPSYAPTIFPSIYKYQKINETSAINRFERVTNRRLIKTSPSAINSESIIIDEITANPQAMMNEKIKEENFNDGYEEMLLTDTECQIKVEENDEDFSINDNNQIKIKNDQNTSSFLNTCIDDLQKQKTLNEYELFGEYVAQELKSLKFEESRKSLKNKILETIIEIIEEENKKTNINK